MWHVSPEVAARQHLTLDIDDDALRFSAFAQQLAVAESDTGPSLRRAQKSTSRQGNG